MPPFPPKRWRPSLTRRQALGVAAGGAIGAVGIRAGIGRILGGHAVGGLIAGVNAAPGTVVLRAAGDPAPWQAPSFADLTTPGASAAAATATASPPPSTSAATAAPAIAALPPGTGPGDGAGSPLAGPPIGDPRILAAHLLRRAGFGAGAAELDAAAALPYTTLVERVIAQAPALPAPPANLARADSPDVMAPWWLAHMATTPAPFPERMTLFWHELLTTDYRKLSSAHALPSLYIQNRTWRDLALGDLRTLLLAASRDAAMMYYLDLQQSSGRAPNENYSRELMELFTLGAGNFSETDVREGARALAGYTVQLVDASGAVTTAPQRAKGQTDAQWSQVLLDLLTSGHTLRGTLDPKRADGGAKTFLGRSGNLGLADVVDAILTQPSCATYIARKALIHFAVPAPSDALVAHVATVFRNSRYDIRSLMRAVFLSSDFVAQANYRSLMRSPVEFAVAAVRATQRTDLVPRITGSLSAMGQRLYDPATVAGWPSNGGWVSSGYWLARVNSAVGLADAAKGSPSDAAHTWLDGVLGPDTAAALAGAKTDADRWFAILSGPEFHLK